jgi:hypothetical protein
MDWMAIYHATSIGSGGKAVLDPLPMRFWGRTEQMARERAEQWWEAEQQKKEDQKARALAAIQIKVQKRRERNG